MSFDKVVRVAVIQASPVLFEKSRTMDKVLSLLDKAAEKKPDLILFPESFIPAYPRNLAFGSKIGSRSEEGRELWKRYFNNSVDVPGEETKILENAVSKTGACVSIGVTEREGKSLFCTQLLFSPKSGLVGKHRKIKPTAAERIVWGEGDGTALTTFKISRSVIGTLICWENYMPLARMALYNKGVNIYLAPTADSRDSWQHTIKHIAMEGRCFVLSANQYVKREDYPDDILELENQARGSEIVSSGGSCIISPLGEYIAEPVRDREEIIFSDLDLDTVVKSSLDFDPAGHYSRPDIFKFDVNDQPDTQTVDA